MHMKLAPKDFVEKFIRYALQTQKKTKISAVAILAQAALESGWGEKAPGNMFFGVKAKVSDPASKRQLITTTEYLDSPNKGHLFPEVLSIEQVGPKRWKYRVKDWFRKYRTAKGSFDDHANFFLQNKRYAEALKVGNDPIAFFQAIAKAGYATSPIYFETLTKVARMIEGHLPPPAAAAKRAIPLPPQGNEEVMDEVSDADFREFVPNRMLADP